MGRLAVIDAHLNRHVGFLAAAASGLSPSAPDRNPVACKLQTGPPSDRSAEGPQRQPLNYGPKPVVRAGPRAKGEVKATSSLAKACRLF